MSGETPRDRFYAALRLVTEVMTNEDYGAFLRFLATRPTKAEVLTWLDDKGYVPPWPRPQQRPN